MASSSSNSGSEESFINRSVDFITGLEYYEPIVAFLSAVVTIIQGIVILVAIGLISRYFLRFLYHSIRMKYLRGMVWNEVLYEGGMNEDEQSSSVGQVQNMAQIIPTMPASAFGLYYGRPITSLMIRKSDDDSVHMYIGMDDRHYDSTRVRSWAGKANCSAEEVDFDEIGFVSKSPVLATMDGFDYAKITDTPIRDTVGAAITNVQSAAESQGTVVISFEPMRRSEGKLLRSHALGRAQKESGSSAQFDMGPRQTSVMMSNSPSRGSMVAFSDNGDKGNSSSLLNAARNGMSAMGIRTVESTYQGIHRRTGIFTTLFSIPLLLLSLIGIGSTTLSVATLAMSVLVLLGTPVFSSLWIELASKNGAVPIPTFWRYSIRRYMTQLRIRLSPFDIDTDELERSYVAEPSTREVIPFYSTPLMQFASMPMTGSGTTNISVTAVPQVSMPNAAENDVIEPESMDDVIYQGISAKSNAPVYRTVKDINFGFAAGGVAGSGKTNLLQLDFVGMSHLARKNYGATADMVINPIWFETKADDISQLVDVTKPYDPMFIKLHDRNGQSRLALEGKRISDPGVSVDEVSTSKSSLISALEAIWGDSFGPRSKQVASASLTIALLSSKKDIEALGMDTRLKNPARPNIIQAMNLLIGGDPSIGVEEKLSKYADSISSLLTDSAKSSERTKHVESVVRSKVKRALKKPESAYTHAISGALRHTLENMDADAVVAEFTDADSPIRADFIKEKRDEELARLQTLSVALNSLVKLHGTRDAVAPLQNKLPQLAKSDGLFETVTPDGERRQEYTIEKMFTYGGPVIVDMTNRGAGMSTDDTRIFVMMVHYLLWDKVQQECGGWGGQGKFIPVYADEVTNFTGRRDDNAACASIIGEVRDQGRSYGISHNVGYQTFAQMPLDTESAIRSFDSLVYMRFNKEEDAEQVLRQVGNRTRYAKENIMMFGRGIGIAHMRIHGDRRAPFTIRTPYIMDWRDALERTGRVRDAFDMIRDDEISTLKEEKRRKVKKNGEIVSSPLISRDDQYQSATNVYVDDPGDDGPTLSWS